MNSAARPPIMIEADEGAGAHWFAVVGVEHKTSGIEIALAAGLGYEFRGDLRRVAVCDSPPDDTAAPDINHQIQMQVDAPHGRRQPGDVPAPDLIRTSRVVDRCGTGDVSPAHGSLYRTQLISALQTIKGRLRTQV
jgi:hypothetical protein